jgi:hypothetical protein
MRDFKGTTKMLFLSRDSVEKSQGQTIRNTENTFQLKVRFEQTLPSIFSNDISMFF